MSTEELKSEAKVNLDLAICGILFNSPSKNIGVITRVITGCDHG